MAKPKEVCGEDDPGFTLWTSAHGFHHYTLSHRRGWRCVWGFILTVLVIALLACIIYYFYYVFSTAVYSRIMLESPASRLWPTLVVCERQAFTVAKINNIIGMNVGHASLLSWSLSPELARPGVYSTDTRIPNFNTEITTIMNNNNIQLGDYEKLMTTMAPNCTQFILECTVGSTTFKGAECCRTYFNPKPVLNQYGTCFTTKGATFQHSSNLAGEGSGMSIVTMHDNGDPFDRTLASSALFGASGVGFAIVDGHADVESSMRGHGQTVQPATLATIGISRTVTDSSDLEFSAIGRMECTNPGSTDVEDTDLTYGVESQYGYTRSNCEGTAKEEILARDVYDCTFSSQAAGGKKRCSPAQSASYQWSFLNGNSTSLNNVETKTMDSTVKTKYDKACPQDCVQDRYQITSSYSELSDNLKQELATKITTAGVTNNPNVVVLKFYLNSLEYTKIHNFPQHGLQFVAEVGGLMAFFLGLSIVSILECMCYCCICTIRRFSGDDEDDEEEARRKRDNQPAPYRNNDDDYPNENRQKQLAARQQQFREMEEKLRRMDLSQFDNERDRDRRY